MLVGTVFRRPHRCTMPLEFDAIGNAVSITGGRCVPRHFRGAPCWLDFETNYWLGTRPNVVETGNLLGTTTQNVSCSCALAALLVLNYSS